MVRSERRLLRSWNVSCNRYIDLTLILAML
jgi:hypothetical protein